MENRYRIRIAISITALAAISILFAARLRRRRQKQKSPRISCYLHSDPKPQLSFKRVLADNSLSHFKHLKFNAEERSSYSHPYESEISGLIENPGLENLFDMEVKPELKTRDSYIWVETESQLKQVADTLSKERVFGVDTEQHSFRSFHGFTALIQISTESLDYLLDTIALHDVMRILAPVFADPRICKVFHGADNDVLWLQRDFHIYVVNLFDTAKACEVLSKPQKSLAYLLETYCSVATNKFFQREDWRQRSLSAEMLEYAQIDAHYLLYIAHCLIDELKQDHDGSTYLEAIRRSNTICLQLYSKEIEGYLSEAAASSILYRLLNGQKGSSISSETQDLVRRLCTWRDLMARVHDESLRYVLSDQAIISLAVKDPTTPSEICDIIAQADASVDTVNFGSSLPSPSPIVCSHLDDFCCLIQDKTSNLNNFSVFLQKCLGQNGSCPLSVYNYALLVNYDLGLTNSKRNGFKNSKQPAKKASRELFVQKFSCKSPVYHNCRIYANDGRLLCYCDRRKLEWYLCRDLAKLVDENPPAIMLLFEPKGRPEDEGNDFYIQSKKNMCVGCGEGNHYLRYRIIPSCYRMHFPEHLKSHRSHDIVLLCVDCHEVAHAAAEKHKREVAAEFGIPLFVKKVCDSKEVPIIRGPSLINVGEAGVSPLHLRTAAMALLRHGSRMPPERREELTQVVMKFYGGREVAEEDLERALLVGMSPHEKRRHRKKRGSSLKHSNGRILPNKMLLETADYVPPSAVEYIIEDQEYCTTTDTGKSGILSNVMVDREFSTTHYNNMHPHEIGVFPTDVIGNVEEDGDRIPSNTPADGIGNAEEDGGRIPSNTPADGIGNAEEDGGRIPSNTPADGIGNAEEDGGRIPSNTPADGIGNPEEDGDSIPSNNPDLGQSSHDGNAQPKTRSKVSLLGHGPHGEKVVDRIMEEYGEAGIHQFCQRWRQIFVEAINPRFLPAGWDVMHSGKRDFGEFSVYNPVNKASDPQS